MNFTLSFNSLSWFSLVPVTINASKQPSLCKGSPFLQLLPREWDEQHAASEPVPLVFLPDTDNNNEHILYHCYRKQMVVAPGTLYLNDQAIKAVCKFCINGGDANSWALLSKESEFYTTQLFGLQGSCIPHYFGEYKQGQCGDSDGYFCIILQDVGTQVPQGSVSETNEPLL